MQDFVRGFADELVKVSSATALLKGLGLLGGGVYLMGGSAKKKQAEVDAFERQKLMKARAGLKRPSAPKPRAAPPKRPPMTASMMPKTGGVGRKALALTGLGLAGLTGKEVYDELEFRKKHGMSRTNAMILDALRKGQAKSYAEAAKRKAQPSGKWEPYPKKP